MPVEIRELQITAVVQDAAAGSSLNSAVSKPDNDVIISACVEQVLEILKEKNER